MLYSDGLLVAISGPSGAGKGTICRRLLEKYKDIGISVSVTTRSPRQGEVDGVHYWFKSKQEFLEMRDNGDLAEWVEYCGNYYGTPKKPLLEAVDAGKICILEIEMQGTLQIKQQFPESIMIFVIPPKFEELRKRIEGRNSECECDILKRLERAKEELDIAHKYDYLVINDDVDKATELVENIIQIERTRISRNRDFINKYIREG